MKRITNLIPFCFAVVFLVVSVPVRAVEPGDVTGFLSRHYPRLRGTIVHEQKGTFYADVRTNLNEATVEIYRQEVKKTGSGRRLVETVVGLARVENARSESARIDLSPAMKSRVRLGDQVRLRSNPLVLRNHSRIDTATLLETIRSISDVSTVLTDPGSATNYYRLSVRPDRLTLAVSRGDTGRILARKKLSQSGSPRSSRQPAVSIERKDSFDRRVNDLERIELTGRRPASLLVLGANRAIGFARFDTAATRLSWSDVNGRVLDVSVGAVDKKGSVVPLVVVLERNGTVRSQYYTFDPVQRSLTKHWSESHSWIHESSGSFYRQTIGLNVPLNRGLVKVRLTDNGPVTTRTPDDLSELYLYSPSYVIRGDRIFAVSKAGSFELYRDGKKVAGTSENYGGSPTTIEARKGESKLNLNPEFVTWSTGEGEHRLLLPLNEASGITAFRGLTYYESSRLYLLTTDGNSIERLWESERLPGYVSSLAGGKTDGLMTVVNTENNSTRLYRVRIRRTN